MGFHPRALAIREVAFARLLEKFCAEHKLRLGPVLEMLSGARPPSREAVFVFSTHLGIPARAWPLRPRVVSGAGKRYTVPVTQEQMTELLRRNARRRRRYPTRVHEVMDRLDWTIAELTEHISAELGYPVSRPSMQFWATGQRKVIKRGRSVPHACAAPRAVREAAHRVTVREAVDRRLGEAAILPPQAWPNVEDEDV